MPSPYDFSIENISRLVTCSPLAFDSTDTDGQALGLIDQACVAGSGGRIEWVGRQRKFAALGLSASKRIDAEGLVGLPGFVDAHTHAVFVGTREREYEMRLKGKTYMEIARGGGGIKSTVRLVRQTSEETLAAAGLAHVRAMVKSGTTTVEIKSGYGLSLDAELKMLRAIRRIGEESRIDVVATFLGAHEIPDEFAGRRGRYVDLVAEEMIPAVASAGLAEFCDVFCEKGVFTPEESRRILIRAKESGLKPMIHADEFVASGGVEVAAEVGAVCAAHLGYAPRAGLEAMRRAGTVAVLLPGVGLGLGKLEFADARGMIEMGLDVALATDFNPGSSMVHSLSIVSSLGCSFMKMTPAEAILAVTRGGAKALGRDDTVGSLEPGKKADLVLFDIPDFRYIPYHVGGARVKMVIKDGRTVYTGDRMEADQ